MDKYEYRMRLEQIKEFYQQEKYKEAAKIANTIDWRKVRDWSTLAMIINIYDEVGQIEDAKNVSVIAYNRKLGGKRLVYKLAELMIRTNTLDEAEELYDEFVSMAPRDLNRYALLYKLNIAKGASTDKLIAILDEYKQHDKDEGCLYELACLYEKAGRIENAMNECDEIILWFNGGDYYEDALKMKRKYGALTHNQKLMLERLDSLREKPSKAKKQTVTIELPKGILKAEDIVKAVTGQLDSKAIEKAARETGDAAKALVVATGTTVNATSGEVINKPAPVEVSVTEPVKEVAEPVPVEAPVVITEDKKPETVVPVSQAKVIESDDFSKRVLSGSTVKDVKAESAAFSPEMQKMLENARAAVKPKELPKSNATYATGIIDISESVVGSAAKLEAEEEKPVESFEDEPENIAEPVELDVSEDRVIGQEPLKPGETIVERDKTIEIPIPNYEMYDTVNIQKELAANIAPYMDDIFGESDENADGSQATQKQEEDSSEPPVITDRPPIRIGDIVDNEEGVFRVIADTNRIIMPNDVGYKLAPLDTTEIEALKLSEGETTPKEEQIDALPEETEPIRDDEMKNISDTLDNIFESKVNLADTKELDVKALKEIAASLEEGAKNDVSKEDEEEELKIDIPDSLFDEHFDEEAVPEAEVDEPVEALEDLVEEVTEEETEEAEAEAIEETVEEEPADEEADLSKTVDIMAAIEKSLMKVDSFSGEATEADILVHADAENELVDDEEEEEENYSRIYDKLFKECFHRYASLKGMKKQIYDALEIIRHKDKDGTSKKGNIIITGNKSVNKLDLGIAFVKALNMLYPDKKRKIAKTNAESLNKRGIKPALAKLMGSALIIEDASHLSDKCAKELYEIMSGNTDDMIVILTGTEGNMIKFVSDKIKLSNYFDSIIEVRKYNVNELVDIAKEYADSKNCTINDKVLLKLFLVIDKLNTGEDSADVAMAERVIDVAIENARDRLDGSLFGRFKKNKDGAIALKESDITTELERDIQEDVEEDNEDE